MVVRARPAAATKFDEADQVISFSTANRSLNHGTRGHPWKNSSVGLRAPRPPTLPRRTRLRLRSARPLLRRLLLLPFEFESLPELGGVHKVLRPPCGQLRVEQVFQVEEVCRRGDEPVRVEDPKTHTAYLIVREDVYRRLYGLSVINHSDRSLYEFGEFHPDR